MRRILIVLGGLSLVAVITGCAYWVAIAVVRPQPAAALPAVTVTATTVITSTDTPAPEASETLTPSPTATDAPTSTATATATATATVLPTATASPTPAYLPAAASADIQGLTHVWQTWNNCGPATLSMYLSHYGSTLTQDEIAGVLRPNSDDKNVRPDELVTYAEGQGFRALARVNGSSALLRLLLSNDVPVIVETWHEPEPGNGMGHYRLLTGYDDAAAEWIAYDSYDQVGLRAGDTYSGIAIPYDELGTLWPVFNRVYVVAYPEELAPVVEGILGTDMDASAAQESALAAAQAEATTEDSEMYAWFNLGSDLVAAGRYQEAATAYQKAEAIGWPKRMLWYQFGIFEAAVETGQTEWAIRLADSVMAQTTSIEEIWYWRGRALAADGRAAEARYSYEQALALHPGYQAATDALAALGG